MGKPVVLSLGMGIDSAAILARWLTDAGSRDFPLKDLVVLTAMVGSEYRATEHLMTTYLLPLMRAHEVRYVQMSRQPRTPGTRKVVPGYVVLDDSITPRRMVMRGPITLVDELRATGTVPQTARNARRCSLKWKAEPLDAWIARNVAGEFRHVIGFAADELGRVAKDRSFSTDPRRVSEFPLVTWGWDRARCAAYLAELFGEAWSRSCCGFCPFQAGPEAPLMFRRWTDDPDRAVEALTLEAAALALNPRSTLFGTRASALQRSIAQGLPAAERVTRQLAAATWAAYEVRRIKGPSRSNPHAITADRSVRTTARGTRAEVERHIAALAGTQQLRLEVDVYGYVRAWARERGDIYPLIEHLWVAAPAGVADKAPTGFEDRWADAIGAPRPLPDTGQLALPIAVHATPPSARR
ncbi:hypothetical protein [Catenuloplanes atrovinosus]|uniref:Phosphoadenosine phosphosulfate reductase n=1 Tax=Catenuloplanes atrovinosus TaxID=137266 RepID=A0AAE3YS20_9ACTN|nr:hypothetical protein [Catenuloplanes atrovinosus]MDR7277615.1 hypothetical protein [Catenuloplanes atrovinosus]